MHRQLALGCLLALVLTAPSLDSRPSAPVLRHHHALHQVDLPVPAAWVRARLKAPGKLYWGSVGIDHAGNILVEVLKGNGGALVRFSPVRRKWLHGAIYLAGQCAAAFPIPSMRHVAWMQDGLGSIWWGRFSSRWTPCREVLRTRHGPAHGLIDGFVASTRGSIWATGWGDPSCGGGEVTDYACGYTYITHVSGPSGRISFVRATRAGKESAIAAGPHGAIWLVVPQYTSCPRPSCNHPTLIRYDQGKRRFSRYVIPKMVWPEARNVQLAFGDLTYLFVTPTGTVWLVAFDLLSEREVRLIRFSRGSFATKIIHLASRSDGTSAFMDGDGNVWISGSNDHRTLFGDGGAFEVNPRTGTTRAFPNLRGVVLEDSHGEMWYVKEPSAPY